MRDMRDGRVMEVCAESEAATCSRWGRKWSKRGDGRCSARVMHYGVYRSPQQFHEEAITWRGPRLSKPWEVTSLRRVMGRSGLFPERDLVESLLNRDQLLQQTADLVERAVGEVKPIERSEEEELKKPSRR
eukprot:3287432-Amphidinium_carterae.2